MVQLTNALAATSDPMNRRSLTRCPLPSRDEVVRPGGRRLFELSADIRRGNAALAAMQMPMCWNRGSPHVRVRFLPHPHRPRQAHCGYSRLVVGTWTVYGAPSLTGHRSATGPVGPYCPMDIVLRPALASDASFLIDMLVAAAFWRSDRPSGSRDDVLHTPQLAHYASDWPQPGDLGFVAENDQ